MSQRQQALGFDLVDEANFKSWFRAWAQRTGCSPDPDHKNAKYDFRAAWRDKARPEWDEEAKQYKWPEQYRMDETPKYELTITIGGVKMQKVDQGKEDGVPAA